MTFPMTPDLQLSGRVGGLAGIVVNIGNEEWRKRVIETLSLSIGVPVAYMIGLSLTMRLMLWSCANGYYNDPRYTCGCTKRRSPSDGWDSQAAAFKGALHNCEWIPSTIAGIFWPVVMVCYALWKPVSWIVTHEPREKLTPAARLMRAEKELAAANAAVTAVDAGDDDDGCGSHGYGHR